MSDQYFVRIGLPSLAALAVLASVGTASAQTSTVVIAPSAPPPPRVETMPPPPAEQSTQAPDEARRIEDIRRRIEARRAQLRQQPQTQNADDGGARARPLSGPAR